MSDTTTHLGLPYLLAAQAQKHVTHNEALRLLEGCGFIPGRPGEVAGRDQSGDSPTDDHHVAHVTSLGSRCT